MLLPKILLLHLELHEQLWRNTLYLLVIYHQHLDLLTSVRILVLLVGDFLCVLKSTMVRFHERILFCLFLRKILKFLLLLKWLLLINRLLRNHSSLNNFKILDFKIKEFLYFSNPSNLIFYLHQQMPHSNHHLKIRLYSRNDCDLLMYLSIYQI